MWTNGSFCSGTWNLELEAAGPFTVLPVVRWCGSGPLRDHPAPRKEPLCYQLILKHNSGMSIAGAWQAAPPLSVTKSK
jgi:hypothetical protein